LMEPSQGRIQWHVGLLAVINLRILLPEVGISMCSHKRISKLVHFSGDEKATARQQLLTLLMRQRLTASCTVTQCHI
jgi:hypothetical protein